MSATNKTVTKSRLRIITFLTLLSSFAWVGRGVAVNIDAVSTNAGDAAFFSHTHTISGSNRLLVVAVELDNGRTLSNVRYAGQSLTFVSGLTHAGGKPRVEIWRFLNPPTGTNSVTVNVQGGADKVTIGAISYTGVDQATPITGVTTASGTSTNPNLTVASQVNDLVQDAMASIAAGAPTVGSGQTQRWNLEMGGPGVSDHYGAGSTKPGSSSVSMNWTISEIKEWVSIGFNVRSGGPNQPPILDSIGPKTVDENQLLEFRVSASDSDLTVPILSALNLPSGAVFVDSANGAGSFSWTPSFTQAGAYNVTFIASDGSAADSEAVTITVNNVNQVPVLDSIGPQTVAEGSNLTFRVHASDMDGDSLILTAANLPANATLFDSGNGAGSFSFNPDFSQAGNYNVIFVASDMVLADTDSVAITVSDVCLAKSGDAKADGNIFLTDIVFIVNYLFRSGLAPNPICRGDANGNGAVLLPDIVYLINYIFRAGPSPVNTAECCL